MDLQSFFLKTKSWLVQYFCPLVGLGFGIRILFIIYYYFESFGLLSGFHYGDVQLNWDDVTDLTSGEYQSYPPLALLLLLFFRILSFGNIKIFMIWAGLLEIGLVWLLVILVLQNSTVPDSESKGLKEGQWAALLVIFNPFWFLHNIFSISNCGYHYTDLFFLYAFLGLIYCWQTHREIASYLCLGLSAAIKWFTLPAIGLYALLLLVNKDLPRFWRFVVVQALILGGFLLTPLFIIPNYLDLYLYYLQGADYALFAHVPFWVKVISILCLTGYFILARLRTSNYLTIAAWSLVIMFSFMFWARLYVRYLLGLILIGHLVTAYRTWGWNIKSLGICLNQHEVTFLLSIIGTLITIMLLLFGWV